MFQTFEDVSDPSKGKSRIAELRKLLATQKLTGFLVPRSDEFQNEYVYAGAERLRWLTGFSGSAGYAVVARQNAAIFVDGRYTLQVRNQVDTSVFDIHQFPGYGLAHWIDDNLEAGDRLGYDPSLHTCAAVKELKAKLREKGASLIAVRNNPVDRIWADRPGFPEGLLVIHPDEYAGESVGSKLKKIQKDMVAKGQDALVISSPPSLAWLFNIRGQDVPCTPLALGYAIVPAKGKACLFFLGTKVRKKLREHLKPRATFHELDMFGAALRELGLGKKKVSIDPHQVSARIANTLKSAGAKLILESDPCILPKALKNETEQEGARLAHLRDGAAVVKFLAWLEGQEPGTVDEIKAVKKLENFRHATKALMDISFETISGAGPNGAIVHYRVSEATNTLLKSGSLFLVDSGGQYLDGTTDITRTVAIGKPAKDMIRHFTLVLAGHIALAMARFPEGIRGSDLDVLARGALWQAGLDYDHGTGHGVGSYLSVHEGPQGISRRASVPLKPGMIISNEPGYYREGKYGIRIENLVLVHEARDIKKGERPMMGFETLTKVPIDRHLIDKKLLGPEKTAWLNEYHMAVRKELKPFLKKDKPTKRWLEKATEPL